MSIVTPPGYLQANSYSAADLRRNNTSLVFDRSLNDLVNQGAQGGFLPGRYPTWSVSGWNITVSEFAGIVENTFATNAGEYPVVNTASQTLTFTASSGTQNRIDVVGVQIQDAFYSGVTNSGSLVIVQGTPSSGTPSPPTLPASFLTLLQASIPASSSTPTITPLRRIISAAGGIRTIIDSQSSDTGQYNGVARSVATGGTGGLPQNILSLYGADSAWHGINRFRLPRPTPVVGNTSTATLAANSTTTIASVTVPDPGVPYYISAGASMNLHNTGTDLTQHYPSQLAAVVDTTSMPSAGSSQMVSHSYVTAIVAGSAHWIMPAHASIGTFTGSHTVNLIATIGAAGSLGVGPFNADPEWWFDVEIQPS